MLPLAAMTLISSKQEEKLRGHFYTFYYMREMVYFCQKCKKKSIVIPTHIFPGERKKGRIWDTSGFTATPSVRRRWTSTLSSPWSYWRSLPWTRRRKGERLWKRCSRTTASTEPTLIATQAVLTLDDRSRVRGAGRENHQQTGGSCDFIVIFSR